MAGSGMPGTDVLIVGAGPVGLTLACDLVRRGVDCRVVERETTPNRASKAKTVQPRTLEVLDDLGAVDHVVRHGVADLPVRLHEPSGGVVEQPSITARARDSFHTPYPDPLWIGQFDVEHALRERLYELGGAVEWGVTALDLVQDEDGATVSLRTPQGDSAVRARYVVAADGGKSAVRQLIGVPLEGETNEEQRWYIGDVTAGGLDRTRMHVWPSDGGMLILTPLPHSDLWQIQTPADPATQPATLTREFYQRLVDERAGAGAVTLTSADWLSVYRVNVRMAEDYRKGRVLLAGDAAHVHSPAGGQGMNTGIQDAYNLGWKLAAVTRGASPALLDSYGAERIPVARKVLALSTEKIDRTTEQATGDVASLSTTLGEITDDATTTGLAVRYGSAGYRAPNVTGLHGSALGSDLFDLLRGPQWNLIAFDSDDPALPALATPDHLHVHRITSAGRARGGDDIADSQGEFQRIYAPRPGELVLVRPDGYLAART
ncbi:FAD-dependent monooxygenase [Streptomyces sp. AcH 505]|uniref:FAD-dependent monooxygenase n=1 Tax=Streptomyces sp. AcH 505 TaxID=352211 RepID=UPI001F518023